MALISTTLAAQDLRAKPQFEVASVRQAAKDPIDNPFLAKMMREATQNRVREAGIPLTGPDRVHLSNWPLLDLIAAAYGVRTTQIAGPDWLSEKSFDVEARVPVGTPTAELNAMLQSLLEERFALKVHHITDSRQGYALTVSKGGPRLKPADPPRDPSRKLSKEEQEAQLTQNLVAMQKQMESTADSDKLREGMTTLSWASITLEELAHRLDRFTDAPVVDATGLTGKYAVTIQVSQSPNDFGNTIFDAVEKFGLKLESRKVSVETLVVDQASKVPTAN